MIHDTPTRLARVGYLVVLAAATLLGLMLATVMSGGSALASDPGPPSGKGIQPVFIAGNPNCGTLGYALGFKPQPEPPPDGDYPFPSDPGNVFTILNNNGTFFDWTSTLGVDVVIVKGGPNADAYIYDPPTESFGDTALHAPINPNNNTPFGISHIEACYDYEVEVEKTAETTFTRTWTWSIAKTASETDLVLSPGQQFLVDYWVDVDATSSDSAWAVSGEIWIHNPSPFNAATVQAVTDVVSPDIAATVDCGPLPAVIPIQGDLHCTYSTPLPDGSDRINTATVATSGAVGGGAAMTDVTFGAPTTEIDEQVDVTDSLAGFLGTIAAPGGSFHYAWPVGPFSDPDDCGDQEVRNEAAFTTNDTGTQGSDHWVVNVFVACAPSGGCTLTQGYWKTHSEHGPAPYDDNWAQLPNGADTPFFGSGQTYLEVLWTAPKGGNAWYILAHQYIAAELNVLNGASIPPDVLAAWTAAGAMLQEFDADGPETIGRNLIPRKDKDAAIALYDILVDYNEGALGPGHCDDDTPAP